MGFKHTHLAFLHPGALSLQQCSGFRLNSAPTEMRKCHPPVLKKIAFWGLHTLRNGTVMKTWCTPYILSLVVLVSTSTSDYYCVCYFPIGTNAILLLSIQGWSTATNPALKSWCFALSTGNSDYLKLTKCFCAGLITAATWTSVLKYMNFNREKKRVWIFFLVGCKSQRKGHQWGYILASYRQLDYICAVGGASTCLSESCDLTEAVQPPGFVRHSCMAVSQILIVFFTFQSCS